MNTNWDLYVLDPLFLIFGIGILTYIVVRQRTSWKWIAYFGATLVFWWAIASITAMNVNQINFGWPQFSKPIFIMLLFLGSAPLISIILRPFATWLTGKTHWRKWWLFIAFLCLVVALMLTLINQNLNSITLFVLVALTLGFGASSSSISYLMLNEQFYYRIAPVLTTTVISIIVSFATFAGSYFVLLENQLNGATHLPVGNAILTSFLLLGFMFFLFFFKEDRHMVRSFELNQLKKMPTFNWKRLTYLLISVFLLTGFFTLTQSSLVTDYLKASLWKRGLSTGAAEAWIRSFRQFFVVPQFLFGYVIYRRVTNRAGYRPVIIGSMGAVLVAVLLICYVDNPYLFIVANLLIGLAYSQVFYAFLSMAITWHYRVNGIPITGLTSASSAFGGFLVELVIQLLKVNQVGIFKDFVHGQLVESQAAWFQEAASGVVIIIFACVGVFCILGIVLTLFTYEIIFADYQNMNVASQHSKIMLREDQMEKSNTRILINEIKNE